jgi:hypothetical protein
MSIISSRLVTEDAGSILRSRSKNNSVFERSTRRKSSRGKKVKTSWKATGWFLGKKLTMEARSNFSWGCDLMRK